MRILRKVAHFRIRIRKVCSYEYLTSVNKNEKKHEDFVGQSSSENLILFSSMKKYQPRKLYFSLN